MCVGGGGGGGGRLKKGENNNIIRQTKNNEKVHCVTPSSPLPTCDAMNSHGTMYIVIKLNATK